MARRALARRGAGVVRADAAELANHWRKVADAARETSWAFGLMSIEIRGFLERMATLESIRRHHTGLIRSLGRRPRGMRRHVRRMKAAARRRAA